MSVRPDVAHHLDSDLSGSAYRFLPDTIGTFPDTGFLEGDTYTTTITPKWYGHVSTESNKRTGFVRSRFVDFTKLKTSLYERINGTLLSDFAKARMAMSSEDSPAYNAHTHADMTGGIADSLDLDFLVLSVERYALRAPGASLRQAATELGTWLVRQPGESSRVNMMVRSGAASILDPFRKRVL